ncbi:MAG: hypothetical protein ABSD98_19165 [Candidatus Korobacteraceae bacterium]|jgi:hypothetical protein
MSETSQIPLPFAEREWIDMPRCCRILGVNETVARRLAESGLILLIEHRPAARKKILYRSVVEHCDRLRRAYGIADSRPRLAPPYRYRDAELLPFPLSDTIGKRRAEELMGASEWTLRELIEEGSIAAYRLAPWTRAPWRISLSSVQAHMQRVLRGVPAGKHAYRQLAVE